MKGKKRFAPGGKKTSGKWKMSRAGRHENGHINMRSANTILLDDGTIYRQKHAK